MKRIVIALLVLLISGISAYAQPHGMMGGGMMGEQKGEMKPPCMMMDEKQQMPMMQMCMPMMKQMMGHGMMMNDMMQMMMNMMDMQEKMMKGMKADEKRQMMKDMSQMKEKMRKMMSMRMGMMMETGDSQAKLKCVEEWLKKAIDLHEIHIKDPKTATEASQMEMMDQMKKAYECITDADTGIKAIPSEKDIKETEKADPHKH